MTGIGVAFISDRGDKYLPECMKSWCEQGLPNLRTTVIDDRDHRLGMAGAVQAAWSWAVDEGFEFLFHVEEDFRFVRAVPMLAMVAYLRKHSQLAQVSLKRQPWGPEEEAAGGFIETCPSAYWEKDGLVLHRRVFSLNPCLIPRSVLEMGWPAGNEAEMTTRLREAGYEFAVYGTKADPPRVLHVGAERSAGWRL